MPLTPAAQYVRDTVRRWQAREAEPRTGIACPACGRELLRARPPLYAGGDRCWTHTRCERCPQTVWLPE